MIEPQIGKANEEEKGAKSKENTRPSCTLELLWVLASQRTENSFEAKSIISSAQAMPKDGCSHQWMPQVQWMLWVGEGGKGAHMSRGWETTPHLICPETLPSVRALDSPHHTLHKPTPLVAKSGTPRIMPSQWTLSEGYHRFSCLLECTVLYGCHAMRWYRLLQHIRTSSPVLVDVEFWKVNITCIFFALSPHHDLLSSSPHHVIPGNPSVPLPPSLFVFLALPPSSLPKVLPAKSKVGFQLF